MDTPSNIINLHGYTRGKIHPDKVLEAAKGQCNDVLILGYSDDGHYYASSGMRTGDILLLLEQFKLSLISGDFE